MDMDQWSVQWIIWVLGIVCVSSSSQGSLSAKVSPDTQCTSHGCMVCHPVDPSSYGTCTQQYIKGQIALVAMWNHVPPSTSCQQDQTCQVSFVVSKQADGRKRIQGSSSRQVDIYIQPSHRSSSFHNSAYVSFRRRPLKQKKYQSHEIAEPLVDSRSIYDNSRSIERTRVLAKNLQRSLGQKIAMVDDVDSREAEWYKPVLSASKSKYSYFQREEKLPRDWAQEYFAMTQMKMASNARHSIRPAVDSNEITKDRSSVSGVYKTNSQPSVPIQYFLSKEMISKIFPTQSSHSSSVNKIKKPTRPRQNLRKKLYRVNPIKAKQRSSRKLSKHVVHQNTERRNRANSCRLPTCFMPNSGVPGGLDRSQIPMLVYFSFDDAVTPWTKSFFDKLFMKSRTNPNGCPIAATHFNSHQNTVYKLVKELYEAGHEIASHSISHRTPTTWWKEASQADYKDEIVGQKDNIHKYSGVPLHEIRGMRVPFLQLGKDNQFNMLEKNHFLYDASMSSRSDPPSWPFTLQYPDKLIGGLCSVEPCPIEPHDLWEVPLNNFYMGSDCSSPMVDGCRPATKEAALKYIRRNFQSHYNSPNKPPFGLNMHASWFAYPQNFQAMDDFIEELVFNEDVWILPIYKVLQWTKNPTPTSELNNFEPFACNKH